MHGTITGNDSDGADPVSQSDLATFKKDMANEVAQLQAVVQRTVDDIVDTSSTTNPNLPRGGRRTVPAG